MIKATFLDFYGTVVHEDGEVIKQITDIIMETGSVDDRSKIGIFWWNEFQTMFMNAYGGTFETQRALEYKSLEKTLGEFKSNANPTELSEMMFAHWIKPPIFDESKEFFEKCPVPIYIVSNIDTADIVSALEYHKLKPAGVFTSEDAKSYKPRKELFQLALQETGLKSNEVVHIGDSLSSDVKGAGALGINTIWVNRSNREVPASVTAIGNLLEAFNTDYFK
ncbi:MAG: HAD family hydrolase [Lachnospiraceae bacterium]|nr:HAD family hydrolase [Lachnospiraceae bacterium]